MSTARLRCEPGLDDKGAHWLTDPFWSRLTSSERMSAPARSPGEPEPPEPRAKLSARRRDFDAVWQRYCDVIRELETTAADLKTLHDRNDQGPCM